jgi:hypothetical protein
MYEGGTYSVIGESGEGDVVEAELGAGLLRWWRNGALLKEIAVP